MKSIHYPLHVLSWSQFRSVLYREVSGGVEDQVWHGVYGPTVVEALWARMRAAVYSQA